MSPSAAVDIIVLSHPEYLGPFSRRGWTADPVSPSMPLDDAEEALCKAAVAFLMERGRILKRVDRGAALARS